MGMRRLMLASVALTMMGCVSGPNSSSPVSMRTYGYAFAPPGFYPFCERNPRLCSTDGKTLSVTLSPRLKSELQSVNTLINRSYKHIEDKAGIDGDIWELPVGGQGDCEDLAIAKKAELMKRGWPASALLLTVATNKEAGHAVLAVRTSEGDMILDNLDDAVRPWNRTPYKYYARQKPNADGGMQWERIGEQGDGARITVTGDPQP